jgi:hypothetical protein
VAVQLELLTRCLHDWRTHLAAELPSGVRRRAGFKRRAEDLAGAIAASLVERPVLCDLMSAQAAVLEHNVSPEAVVRSKLATLADAEAFAELVGSALPELNENDAWNYIVATWLMASALCAYRRPPEAVLAACSMDHRLDAMKLDFPVTLADHLTTLAIGLHARHA